MEVNNNLIVKKTIIQMHNEEYLPINIEVMKPGFTDSIYQIYLGDGFYNYYHIKRPFHEMMKVFGYMNCSLYGKLTNVHPKFIGTGWSINVHVKQLSSKTLVWYFVGKDSRIWLNTEWSIYCEGMWAFYREIFGNKGELWNT